MAAMGWATLTRGRTPAATRPSRIPAEVGERMRHRQRHLSAEATAAGGRDRENSRRMDRLAGPRGGNVSPNDDNEAAGRAARTRLGHALKRDPTKARGDGGLEAQPDLQKRRGKLPDSADSVKLSNTTTLRPN